MLQSVSEHAERRLDTPATRTAHEVRYQERRSVSLLSTPPPLQVRLCCIVEPPTIYITSFVTSWANARRSAYLSDFNVNLSVRLIGDASADVPWTTKVARAIVQETPTCDAFYGSFLSRSAEVGSAVNSKLWMDMAAATVLSDKSAHPFFSRVFPHAKSDGEMLAPILKSLGVKAAHVLCADETYGRSVGEGFRMAAHAAGVTVVESSCFLRSASAEEIAPLLRSMMARRKESEWIVLAMFFTEFPNVKAALRMVGGNTTMQVISSRCPQTGTDALPGFLCATPHVNSTHTDMIYAARDNRPVEEVAAFRNEAVAAGVPNETVYNAARTSPVSTMCADGVDLVVRAFASFRTIHGFNAIVDASELNPLQVVKHMRANVSLPFGAAGPLSLSKTGDRTLSSSDIKCRFPNGSMQVVALFEMPNQNAEGTSNETKLTIFHPIYMAPHGYVSALPLPYKQDEEPATASTSNSMTLVIVVVVAASVVIVCAIVAAVIVVFVCRPKGSARDPRHAPTDSTKPFAIAFTDIQQSTALWAELPEGMGDALDAHNMIVRRMIAKHKGYEVKTIGDSFMVAFSTATAAAEFGVELQHALVTFDWQSAIGSNAIDAAYDEFLEEAREQSRTPQTTGSSSVLSLSSSIPMEGLQRHTPPGTWNGLRVRVGVAFGEGRIDIDPVTDAYDYYGTVVNTAARVECAAHGGQVILSGPAHEAVMAAVGPHNPRSISDTSKENASSSFASNKATSPKVRASSTTELSFAVVQDLGPQTLRGLRDPVPLFLYRPTMTAELLSRRFPPLRIERPDGGAATEIYEDGVGEYLPGDPDLQSGAPLCTTNDGSVHAMRRFDRVMSQDRSVEGSKYMSGLSLSGGATGDGDSKENKAATGPAHSSNAAASGEQEERSVVSSVSGKSNDRMVNESALVAAMDTMDLARLAVLSTRCGGVDGLAAFTLPLPRHVAPTHTAAGHVGQNYRSGSSGADHRKSVSLSFSGARSHERGGSGSEGSPSGSTRSRHHSNQPSPGSRGHRSLGASPSVLPPLASTGQRDNGPSSSSPGLPPQHGVVPPPQEDEPHQMPIGDGGPDQRAPLGSGAQPTPEDRRSTVENTALPVPPLSGPSTGHHVHLQRRGDAGNVVDAASSMASDPAHVGETLHGPLAPSADEAQRFSPIPAGGEKPTGDHEPAARVTVIDVGHLTRAADPPSAVHAGASADIHRPMSPVVIHTTSTTVSPGGSTPFANAIHTEVSELHDFFSKTVALFAPLKPATRDAVVEDLARAWRVPDFTRARETRGVAQDIKGRRSLMLLAALLRARSTSSGAIVPLKTVRL